VSGRLVIALGEGETKGLAPRRLAITDPGYPTEAPAPAFVNWIWPTLILSFGPPIRPNILPNCFLLPVAQAEAEPCAASFAARLGRSVGRGYRQQAIRKAPPAPARPD
jgi:hypothetical protein